MNYCDSAHSSNGVKTQLPAFIYNTIHALLHFHTAVPSNDVSSRKNTSLHP